MVVSPPVYSAESEDDSASDSVFVSEAVVASAFGWLDAFGSL